jgi:hypothetical protein
MARRELRREAAGCGVGLLASATWARAIALVALRALL